MSLSYRPWRSPGTPFWNLTRDPSQYASPAGSMSFVDPIHAHWFAPLPRPPPFLIPLSPSYQLLWRRAVVPPPRRSFLPFHERFFSHFQFGMLRLWAPLLQRLVFTECLPPPKGQFPVAFLVLRPPFSPLGSTLLPHRLAPSGSPSLRFFFFFLK